MIFRQATLNDLDDVIRITRDGRAALAARGLDQWQGGNPTPERLRADIKGGYTFVVEATEADVLIDAQNGSHPLAPGTLVGTVAFVGAGEPDYSRVTSGAWLIDAANTPEELRAKGQQQADYVTLHRLATAAAATRRGVASLMLNRCFDRARILGFKSVRADTHEGNIPMQHAFEKCGMTRCCEIEITNPLEPTKKRIGFEIVL